VQNDELGHCIRAWRDRLDPAAAGLPAGPRRRAPGLAALARALRLSDEERHHLYLVAGQVPPASGTIDRHITPGVMRMVSRLDEMAVTVYDATWELITWNDLGAALLGDLTLLTGRDRNLVWRQFNGAVSRFRRDPQPVADFERELVADLHAAVGKYPDDERLAALVADLRASNERFEELWAARPVAVRTASRKTIEHPEVGPITVDCDVLNVAASDLRLVVYSVAPGTQDAEKLALLGVVGLQRMAG
jgi:hypothetical protein